MGGGGGGDRMVLDATGPCSLGRDRAQPRCPEAADGVAGSHLPARLRPLADFRRLADGVRDVLAQTQTPAWDITRRYSISGPLGLGPLLSVTQALVVAISLLTAWRHRRSGPEVPMAAGIAGSLLATPYLGFQDFLMLIVAGWLVLRAGANVWQIALLVIGYVLLQFVIVVLAAPILIAEALLLLSLLLRAPGQAPGNLGSMHGVVGGHMPHE
jgi:hypothetical protein